MKKFLATQNDHGRILLKYLINVLDNVPVSRIYKLLREKDVKVNGSRTSDGKLKVEANDEIVVYGLEKVSTDKKVSTTPVIFKVNYEDENILVVEKPLNVPMHDDVNSLDNQVKNYLNFTQEDSFKVSHISRLDKPTTGLVIYAKNYPTLVQLTEKIAEFEKIYTFKSDYKADQVVELKLQYNPVSQRTEVTKRGQIAITEFRVQDHQKFAILKTGRKHQIRATLAHLGFPIYGDLKYGGKKAKRLFLHCCQIQLRNLEGDLAYLNNRIFKTDIKW